jgi:hypothetical protein
VAPRAAAAARPPGKTPGRATRCPSRSRSPGQPRSTLLPDVLNRLRAIRQSLGGPRRWPGKLHADKGYDYRFCRELVGRRGMIARIAGKGIESSTHLGQHRYVIER